jgi:hypothetical protein
MRPVHALALVALPMLCVLCAVPARARAQSGEPEAAPPVVLTDPGEDADARAARTENRINLRVGAASTDTTGMPVICMEVRAVALLAVEGCGTGSGFLHSRSGREMAHFRAKWQALGRVVGGGKLRLHGGLGFAELQLDADQPGFDFGAPQGSRIETAGPEGSLSLSWLRPMRAGWELVANATGGMAWLPHADELAAPQARAQPFVSLEIGVGW